MFELVCVCARARVCVCVCVCSGSDKGRAGLLASLSGDGRAGPADAIHNNGTLSGGNDKGWAGSDAIHNDGTLGGSGLWRYMNQTNWR